MGRGHEQSAGDFLDCLYLHGHHLPLGALVWAAAGKDPGLTPEYMLDWALRGNRFRPDDLQDVRLGKPIDLVETKQRWIAAVHEAREIVANLPPAELGCFYLNAEAKPVCPVPSSSDFAKLTRHNGSLRGALPQIVEE